MQQVQVYGSVSETLHRFGLKSEHIIVASDLEGADVAKAFARDFEKRYVCFGHATQHMVASMAGMAQMGKTVFIVADIRSISGQSLEIMRTLFAQAHVNVKILGLHAGIAALSHQQWNDIALMSSLPNMKILCPTDEQQTAHMLEALFDDFGPAYVRLPSHISSHWTHSSDFGLGAVNIYEGGRDIGFISLGSLVHQCDRALDLLQEKSVYGQLLSLSTLMPRDDAAIIEFAKECKLLVTVEDQYVSHGIGAQIADVLAAEYPRDLFKIGIPQNAGTLSGSREDVYARFGFDASTIAEKVYSWWRQLGYY